jgi:hypothetical protein
MSLLLFYNLKNLKFVLGRQQTNGRTKMEGIKENVEDMKVG